MNSTRRRNKPVTWTLGAAVAVAAPAVLFFASATAHADNNEQDFQSPSGNIECWVRAMDVGCDVGDHTYIPPTPQFQGAPLTPCPTDVVRYVLHQGHQPEAYCHSGPTDLGTPGLKTLNYGQTVAAGPMTCVSETSGVTCTDTSTGRFFRASRDSYQLG